MVERTVELHQAKVALVQRAKELRLLLAQTVTIQERERARIAHNTHDGVNQLIIGATLEVKAARECLAGGDGARVDVALQRAHTVLNREFGEGCAASYKTGLAASRRTDGGRIVIAAYRGVPGHPLLFDRQLFPDLAALHGDKAAWKLINRHPEWVRVVEMDRPSSHSGTVDDWHVHRVGPERGADGEAELTWRPAGGYWPNAD